MISILTRKLNYLVNKPIFLHKVTYVNGKLSFLTICFFFMNWNLQETIKVHLFVFSMYLIGEIILKVFKVKTAEKVYSAVLVSTLVFSILYFLLFIVIMQNIQININLKIIVIFLLVLLVCKKELKLNLINSKIELKINY